MAKVRIGRSTIERLPVPQGPAEYYFDTLLTGFAVRVSPRGVRTFIAQGRADGRVHRHTIGRFLAVTPEEARKRAQSFLSSLAAGEAPKRRRELVRLRDAMAEWLDVHVAHKCKSRTRADYREIAGGHAASSAHCRSGILRAIIRGVPRFVAEVFISYAAEDRAAAEALLAALAHEGLSAWLDRERLKGGDHYPKRIGEAIAVAQAVFVLWSEHAIASEWVYAEAQRAKRQGKIVPVWLGEARADLPLPFDALHTPRCRTPEEILPEITARLAGERPKLAPNAKPGDVERDILDPKLEPLPARAVTTRPTSLLHARHAVVPFDDIHGLKDELIAWATAAPAWAVGRTALGRLIHGAGGLGKTRLRKPGRSAEISCSSSLSARARSHMRSSRAGIIAMSRDTHLLAERNQVNHGLAGDRVLPCSVGSQRQSWDSSVRANRPEWQLPLVHQLEDVASRHVQERRRLVRGHFIALSHQGHALPLR